MAGPRPEPPRDIPEEQQALAGEYVIGALDADAMRAVRVQARGDAALDAAIAGWERRLAPLAGLVDPVPPPEALWRRLNDSIASEDVAADRSEASARRPVTGMAPLVPRRPAAARKPAAPAAAGRGRVLPWQLATAGSLALAAALALALVRPDLVGLDRRPPPLPVIAALMPTDMRAPGFLAEARADGVVVLSALAPISVPAGHDLELWILRPGETAPAPLGVLPAGGARVTLKAMPPDGTQMMVSLEPPGGSPTGRPTGPVLYAGAFVRRGA